MAGLGFARPGQSHVLRSSTRLATRSIRSVIAALTTAAAIEPKRLRGSTFAAFQSRPFTLLWANTLSFALSQAVRQFAFVWLALELSGKGRALGLISFALGIPVLIFGLPAGLLADRMDRRTLLFTSQVAALAVTTLAAVLIFADAMTTAITFGLAIALGATVAFGQPVRNTIVPTLVERRFGHREVARVFEDICYRTLPVPTVAC